MKVAVQCKSPLLQKSLELFLGKHLSRANKCDILIRDEVCLNDARCFYIGSDADADLQKPFSKAQLILALEARYAQKEQKLEDHTSDERSIDFEILEKRIESLTQEYQANIIRAVRAFYEK